MSHDERTGNPLSDEEYACLERVAAHAVRQFPPTVLHVCPEPVLHHLESLGLIARVTGPATPLEVRHVEYRATERGRALLRGGRG